MIRSAMVWGVARAELRLTRRLVRYWIFVVIAALAAILNYANFWFIHYFFSPYSASAAAANPRFFMGNAGVNFILIFLVFGVVFLGFDVRARDQRERIFEVLDALPISNLELLGGRAVGLMIASWIPMTVVVGIISLVGWLLGNPVEPYSVVQVLLVMAFPAYLFTIGLVYLLTIVLRHRLLASVVSIVVLIGTFIGSLWLVPIWAAPFIDVTGGLFAFGTDIVPSIVETTTALHRIGYMLGGVALLIFAAALHPRRDDAPRARNAAIGAVIAAVAVGLIGVRVGEFRSFVVSKAGYLAAHEARRDEPAPDLVSIDGDVRIDPGKRLEIDVRLRFRAPEGRPLERALFSFNPGLAIASIDSDSGESLSYTHEDGLLEVDLGRVLEPGAGMTIALAAAGRPDPKFSYLEQAVDPFGVPAAKGQIVILGYEPIIFTKRHVALLPGVRWLPASGTEAGRGDGRTHPTDFFEIDLIVDVPEGWIVAGPGRRHPADGAEAGRTRFRFSPGAYLPAVALVAGPYESRSAEIDGVLMEALFHPKHLQNAEFFEDAAGEIRDWLSESLTEAREVGLEYPYDALTLVEVPQTLRGFAGGWRMDTTFAQPGLILMRETGFPTARFDAAEDRLERAADDEGGIPRAKRELLGDFFENDLNGGNPFLAAARSFFGFQTAGVGAEGVPLDFVWEQLATRVLSDKIGYFSVHFFEGDFGGSFQKAAMRMRSDDRISDDYSRVLLHMLTSTPEVWDTALGLSLVQLDPWEDPKRTINVLSLKGGAMARSLLDSLGREKTGQFLGALRRRGAGRSYARADVIAAGVEVGEDLEPWLDVWLDETDLPGFTLGEVDYFRITDADDGSPRYQIKLTVRNEESPPGVLRLEYCPVEEEGSRCERESGDPVVVAGNSAVELALVTSAPMRWVRVSPYFALNRDPFSVPLPTLDEEKIVEAEPVVGYDELDWEPPIVDSIIVDDLDGGFGLEEEGRGRSLRVAGRGTDLDLDQGIPISTKGVRPPRWSRMTASYAFGKYRRTMAVIRAGDGERTALFAAELPDSGSWQLEYYLPQQPTGRTSRRPGTWSLLVVDGSGEREVSFDADGGESGWNSLGTFEVQAGEVVVKISDSTDGDYVVADAIRWLPVTEVASHQTAR
jgi:ABC-type transport system involved in multi-copper enzyme maturation permease subunit